MPTISMFFGIIIRIYFAPKEHQPPHFHAYYAEHKATVDIQTCEILEGELPKKTKETCVGMGGITSRGANGQLEVGYEWRKPL